jgi:hypothetical protein
MLASSLFRFDLIRFSQRSRLNRLGPRAQISFLEESTRSPTAHTPSLNVSHLLDLVLWQCVTIFGPRTAFATLAIGILSFSIYHLELFHTLKVWSCTKRMNDDETLTPDCRAPDPPSHIVHPPAPIAQTARLRPYLFCCSHRRAPSRLVGLFRVFGSCYHYHILQLGRTSDRLNSAHVTYLHKIRQDRLGHCIQYCSVQTSQQPLPPLTSR